jgi:death-on-curing protein
MPRRIYPTVAETIATHRMLIEEFGGRHGIRDKGLLESAVFRPQSGYYGGIIEEAAALMESLANNRGFIQRTGRKAISVSHDLCVDSFHRQGGLRPHAGHPGW